MTYYKHVIYVSTITTSSFFRGLGQFDVSVSRGDRFKIMQFLV